MNGSGIGSRLAWFSREPATVVLLMCLTVFGSFSWLRAAGHLQFMSLATYDFFLRLHQPPGQPHDPRIVHVVVTEEDINAIGEWPLSDETLARALESLERGQPRAIGLDIYRDQPVPPGTDRFERQLLKQPGIIMINKFDTGAQAGIPGPAQMEERGRVGFSDMVLDPGGEVRRGLLFLDAGTEVASSFALKLALHYLRHEGIVPQPGPAAPEHIRLGNTTLPPLEPGDGPYINADAAGYQLLLDFKGGASPFARLSLSQLLENSYPRDTLTGKVVLVGVAADSVKDLFLTPFSSSHDDVPAVPGIVLHAHLISQLLRAALDNDRPLQSPVGLAQSAWIFLWCLAGAIIGLRTFSEIRFFLVVAGGLGLLGATAFMMFTAGWWIPLVTPALGWFTSLSLVTAFLSGHENAQRKLMMQLFSSHVSENVASEIWSRRYQFLQGKRLLPQEETATVLFTDIERFTTISEALAPHELIDWLNIYLESMANIVMQHEGMVDDYYGDAIKANFGVPVRRALKTGIRADAINAVQCALHMKTELVKINRIYEGKGLPGLHMRAGICTGNIVSGCVGSTQRLKYTTVGDTVNIAARLESFDKSAIPRTGETETCRILIAESTWRLVKDLFSARLVGEISLKGKFEKLNVYHVTGKSLEK